MDELIEQLAEKLAKKYSLDKDALLNMNSDIFYLDIGCILREVDRKTHLSKVISKDKKVIDAFIAIQTLLNV